MEKVIKLLKRNIQEKQDFIDYFGDSRDDSAVFKKDIEDINKVIDMINSALANANTGENNALLPDVIDQ